jgi:hypothetical protein
VGYPPRSFEPQLTLSLAQAPVGECVPATHPVAEVLDTDGAWQAVTVLAWHRLEKPYIQRITLIRVTWLVQLCLADGTENWYEHDALGLRPVNESGSSSDSGK